MATKHRPPAKSSSKKVVGTVNVIKPYKGGKKAGKKSSSKKSY